MGNPFRRIESPASTALQVIEAHRLFHLVTVIVHGKAMHCRSNCRAMFFYAYCAIISQLYVILCLLSYGAHFGLLCLLCHNKPTVCHTMPTSRGGVEDTRLEAKAKDTKKIRGQGQGQPFREQTLSRPRTGMLEAKAKDQGHKRKCSPKKKKKVFTKIFQAISTKKRFLKNFSSAPQNFNNSKNTAVLEPRTGQFSRT